MGLMFEDVGKWTPEDLSDGLRMSEKLSNHFGAVTLISSALMMATTRNTGTFVLSFGKTRVSS